MRLLRLRSDSIPRLADVNRVLSPLTKCRVKAVKGYIPPMMFFEYLERRILPATVTIRGPERLDYLPEPDIFHDIAGHAPMNTSREFTETLVRFGSCAYNASRLVQDIWDEAERIRTLASMIRALSRCFWFTIEFGLIQSEDGVRAYGSGLLSSYGELQHSILSSSVQRKAISLESVINQDFAIDHYQPVLYVIESFEHLYELVGQLCRWAKDGRLNQVASGERPLQETLRSGGIMHRMAGRTDGTE